VASERDSMLGDSMGRKEKLLESLGKRITLGNSREPPVFHIFQVTHTLKEMSRDHEARAEARHAPRLRRLLAPLDRQMRLV